MLDEVGVVVIGRNEGERLKRCLRSVLSQTRVLVYIDSGSSDESVQYAQSRGIDVVLLDMSIPFSAARARNNGFGFLQEKLGGLKYVQFIDGDCEIADGWLESAKEFLDNNEEYAIAGGRRKEKRPNETIYNMLCDIEWNTPIGDRESCGGDFLARSAAFQDVQGFNPSVIAGEEPDLCYRLRQKGWKVKRLDSLMTLHDASMTSFSQWWRRAKRAGHAYGQGFLLHARDRRGHFFRECARIWVWAAVFPLSVVLSATLVHPALAIIVVIYPIRWVRICWHEWKRHGDARISAIYSAFIVLAVWPQLLGQLTFLGRKLLRKNMSIIEHK
jgi:glycosyltransferase involved in cell wall biosynthesis